MLSLLSNVIAPSADPSTIAESVPEAALYVTCEFASPVVAIAPLVVYLVIESPVPRVLSVLLSICPNASLGLVPTDEEVSENDFPDKPSGEAIAVSNILIDFDAVSGNAAGFAVLCVLILNVTVLVPVPVRSQYRR